VCKASGQSPASLLKPLLEKLSPPLERRRLMPLKHVQLQMGNAAAFTYCMQQRPPLLPLSQVCLISMHVSLLVFSFAECLMQQESYTRWAMSEHWVKFGCGVHNRKL
jgi:hypothetical protein